MNDLQTVERPAEAEERLRPQAVEPTATGSAPDAPAKAAPTNADPTEALLCALCRAFLLGIFVCLFLFYAIKSVPEAAIPATANPAVNDAVLPTKLLSLRPDRTPPNLCGVRDRTVGRYEPFSLTAGVTPWMTPTAAWTYIPTSPPPT